MSDQNAKLADPRIVVVNAKSGKVDSNRWHAYVSCSFISDQPAEELEYLSERETKLLNLKMCSACERRKTGGPAIDALKEVVDSVRTEFEGQPFDKEAVAWYLFKELKQRGFYLASRKAK